MQKSFMTYKMKIQDEHVFDPNIAYGTSIADFIDCILGLSDLSEAIISVRLKLGQEMIDSRQVVHKGKSFIIGSGDGHGPGNVQHLSICKEGFSE